MEPDYPDAEPMEPPPPRSGATWKYLAAAVVCLLLGGAILRFAGVFLGVAELLTSVVFPVLCVGVLGWFAYWLLLSRRGIIGRRLHYRRMQARRHARWIRQAAEQDRPADE